MPKTTKKMKVPAVLPPETNRLQGLPEGTPIPERILFLLQERCIIEDKSRIPGYPFTLKILDQLGREDYEYLNEILERLDGKYLTNRKVHGFPYDMRAELARVIAEGRLPARNPLEFFETPKTVIETLRDWLDPEKSDISHYLRYRQEEDGYEIRILEPSAGTGVLADLARELFPQATIHCYELHPHRRQILQEKGYTVIGRDFLQENQEGEGYDLVLMNPPFGDDKYGNDAYMQHIYKGHRKLRDHNSRQYTVAPIAFQINDSKANNEFFAFCVMHGSITHLPSGTFKSSGTGVNTCLLELEKEILWPYDKYDEPYEGWDRTSLWHLFLHFDNEQPYADRLWKLQQQIMKGEFRVYANGQPSPETRNAILKLFEEASFYWRKRYHWYIPVRPQDRDLIIETVMERTEQDQEYLVEAIRQEPRGKDWQPPARPEPPEARSLLDLFDIAASH